ncbi:F0F1 ATP synthase subunit epsilon [Methanotrichaceae archaeon M04Ac]|uniref:F0F1 ATP synthase subunit epsilon n=1 Tax=Candidatus Methanocrinis alkalitolerans TaxID=3033395 RepID=A0ABT5XHE6_9EURY|nr:F0F1 ATP synthase subunit epsilon [Candidatus Methanocrinis alkalitolerans]MCR3883778.1 F0F1 ATP synthase subunit epsilon [Methanothrix sp.]MDF0594134.1 F0F1 ATP synthase subunit epsilon [Candidatus Methanocrinis alkalitolerans]
MRLKVLLPTKILIDEEVTKVVAEAEDGSFCILPRHIDFVAAMVPGIFSFTSGEGEEFLGIDEGILVKCASTVTVSTRKAIRSRDLGMLKRTVQEEFRALDEREKKTRTILAKLEADFARSVFEKM